MYSTALSDNDRELVESYLGMKWGLTQTLPSDHNGLSEKLPGWSVGVTGPQTIATNFSGVGGLKQHVVSASPATDNLWHNIVTTFDGASRKVYLDGVEVSSTQFTGSVDLSNSALVLGAFDNNTTAAPIDEIKNVAATGHSRVKLDEVRFYGSALSATDVSNLYNSGKGDLGKIGGFTTLPPTVKATAGSAFSTTVTADFINPVYSAYNLPNGLSINSSTGEISGTPTVGGIHLMTVSVTGGSQEAPKKAVGFITYSAQTSAPKFGTPGAQNVVGDSALILSEIEQTGASSNTVDLVWDTSDKGTSNVSDWNGSATAVGTGKEGFYGKQLTDLTPGGTYYYRARAELELSPLDHAGDDLKLWADASELSAIPSTWTDMSGSGNNLSKVGTPSLVTNAQNGHNAIRTVYNSQYYKCVNSNLKNTDQTWMLMVKPHATTAANHSSSGIFGYSNGSVSMQFRFESLSTPTFKGRLRWHNGSSWSTTTGYWTDAATNWHLFSASFDRANSKIRLYKDSTELSTGWSQAITWGEDGTVWVSARAGAGRTVSGDYGEFLIYSSVDATLRAKMEGYLLHKWGLSANLPSGHTYKSASPKAIAWSDAQSFTTPINTSAPTLGSQSTANLDTTSADIQVVLTDNGNAATTVVFYWGDNDGGTTKANWDSNVT